MVVIKFGGSSISSAQSLQNISQILGSQKENFLVVVSAFSGVTNLLENLAESSLTQEYVPLLKEFQTKHNSLISEVFPKEITQKSEMLVEEKTQEIEQICQSIYTLQELSPKTQALLLSYGELISSQLLQMYFETQKIDLNWVDSRKLIKANHNYLQAEVDFTESQNCVDKEISNKNYITGGFIASNNKNETVTLGRGGSDYSASILAAALNAERLEIWSDVNGMHTAHPKYVKDTHVIPSLSYEEAFELAYFGAKVLYPPSIIPVMNKKIPLYFKNTFHPEAEGTIVGPDYVQDSDKIQGVSSLENIAIITFSGVDLSSKKGIARRIFQVLEENSINIILITQACSEQSMGIGIPKNEVAKAENSINTAFKAEIEKGLVNPLAVDNNKCIIALVGDNMKHTVGLCGKIFGALGENGINVVAIAQGASERNISIVIDQEDEIKALNVIHERFFNNVVKNVHLFIAGVGNVGKEFLNILNTQHQKLLQEYKLNLKIIGIANSKKYIINEEGLGSTALEQLQKNGTEYNSFEEYTKKIIDLNMRNSILVDNTAAEEVSQSYAQLLSHNIAIATCNKIACSSPYENYQNLKNLAKEHNSHFKYETSVGAALPIIKTIQDLNISGDKIHKIQAVISGSLNFIFNQYNGENSFASVVKQAKEEGYTEPNPLIDLSGLDVMRKILILSREAGYENEIDSISFESFLPEECENAKNNDELFESLLKNENHFKEMYTKASKNGNKLKVLAQMEEGNMKVALKEIEPQSPFYNLEGKDNVIALNTERYPSEPLVIKGAGAGGAVTASGVFSDVMLIVNK